MWREVLGCSLAWLTIACGGQARRGELDTSAGASGAEAGASTTPDPCAPRDLEGYCQSNRCPRVQAEVVAYTCEVRSDAESVCTSECDGVPAPIDDGSVPVDPLNPFVELCFEKKLEVSSVWLGKNACGHLLYEVTYWEPTRDRYCFDDAGRLIGRSRWEADSGVVSAEGVSCEPFGYFDRVGCVNDMI